MIEVKVFPDYCSTGLWINHRNVDESKFEGILSQSDLMALKYWHEVWEFAICTGHMSSSYEARWIKDGKEMCEAWNDKQDVYNFICDVEGCV